MAVYGTNNVLAESSLLNIDVEESIHEAGLAGAYNLVIENETNYFNLMEAVGVSELAYFEENGVEMQYEGASLKGFFAKIKEFFVKVFEKLKSLFKKFIATMDSIVLSDKDFVKKYREALLKVDTKGFKWNGYDYTPEALDLNKAYDGCVKVLKSYNLDKDAGLDEGTANKHKDAIEAASSKDEDIKNKLRGAMVGKSSVDADEYSNEMNMLLRNGKDEAQEFDKVNVPTMLEDISSYKEAKKVAEKALSDIEKAVNDIVKALDKAEGEIVKKLPDADATQQIKDARATAVAYTSKVSGYYRHVMNMLTVANGAKLTALKSKNKQAKAVCTRLLTYKPVKESVYSENSDLINVNFI